MNYLLGHLLRTAAGRWADRTALVDGDVRLTYRELADTVAGLAATLRANGIRRGDRVAIHLPKSRFAVCGILAALDAEAVYVPIDPGAPPARAGFILRDCGVRCLITDGSRLRAIRATADSMPPLVITSGDEADEAMGWTVATSRAPDAAPFSGVDTDLAYILYTSGSTGVPKGVMISHRASLMFVNWTRELFRISHDDVVSSHAPFHFDLSILDLFTSLSAGACIILIPEYLAAFPARLDQLIRRERISVWYSVPSALILLMTKSRFIDEPPQDLRLVLFAGEVFPPRYLHELRARIPARMFNLYGPTETNVCTLYEVTHPAPPDKPIPIGHAPPNYDVFAVTEDGRLAAPGQEGQLMARGPGLMTGYWGDPERTRRVLIQNPLNEHWSDIVCATGDIVSLGPDGEYRFHGRRDHMVKIRGYRVELGEVENVLLGHEAVHEAAVVVTGEGPDARLRAFVALHESASVDSDALLAHCRAALVNYMVPDSIAVIPELPRTSTGKIDRPGLAALAAS